MVNNKNYNLESKRRWVNDEASVRFHAKNHDYFGTAAALIKLIEEKVSPFLKNAPKEERALIKQACKNLESDLMILQENYQIKAKPKNSQAEAKGKLKSQ